MEDLRDSRDYYKKARTDNNWGGSAALSCAHFPNGVAELCKIIQGDLIHRELAA